MLREEILEILGGFAEFCNGAIKPASNSVRPIQGAAIG